MANGRTKAVVAATFCAVARWSSVATAEPVTVATVVAHVRDYQQVPAGELAAAQQVASHVYEKIGVRLAWTGRSRVDESAGSLHVDVVILDSAMTTRNNPEPKAFGDASHATRRAYIYYRRILDYARQTQSDPVRALALVFAHELGHVLLPEYSHSPSGLMRGSWEGRLVYVPPFSATQAEAIRATLATQ